MREFNNLSAAIKLLTALRKRVYAERRAGSQYLEAWRMLLMAACYLRKQQDAMLKPR